MGRFVARKLVQKMLLNDIDVASGTVAILGITFKENCPDIRNSKVIDIINELKNWNVNVEVFDPWADPAVGPCDRHGADANFPLRWGGCGHWSAGADTAGK